ncbi:hypothetical protein [Streptomyces sp. G45]|uniref:hypothetical protein n=1 Tax=Streptomyces sp. G45 TaxID=3406627 RepID=UPI003C1895E6
MNADREDGAAAWTAWFDSAEYHVTVGVCEFIAAQHDPRRAPRAINLIQQGTAQRPTERTRSRAFDHIALARAYVRHEQLDAARDATSTALDLFGHVASSRVADRLRELDHELQAAPDSTLTVTTRNEIERALQTRG